MNTKHTAIIPATPGSISHGTLREADLLSTFISELEGLILVNADHFSRDERDRLCGFIGEAQDCFSEDGNDIAEGKEEAAGYVLESLFDALDLFSPENHTFSAHEGDGSDFGYWPFESEDEETE